MMTENAAPDSTGRANNKPAKGNKQQSNSDGSAEKQELKILMLHGTCLPGSIASPSVFDIMSKSLDHRLRTNGPFISL